MWASFSHFYFHSNRSRTPQIYTYQTSHCQWMSKNWRECWNPLVKLSPLESFETPAGPAEGLALQGEGCHEWEMMRLIKNVTSKVNKNPCSPTHKVDQTIGKSICQCIKSSFTYRSRYSQTHLPPNLYPFPTSYYSSLCSFDPDPNRIKQFRILL